MNDVSWEGFERFLQQNAKSCVKWLPLMRDGEVEFQPAHARLTAQGEVENVKIDAKMTIQTTPIDLATTSRTDWLEICKRLEAAYPALGRGGKSGVKAALIRDYADVLAYDSGNGFWRSIGGQLDKYKASLAAPPVLPIVPAPVPIAPAPLPVAHAVPMMAQPLALPTVPAVPAPSGAPVEISDPFAAVDAPSKSQQLLRTCGRILPLISYLKKKKCYEFMTKAQFNAIRAWTKEPEGRQWVKESGLDPDSFHIHHVHAAARGGMDSVFNLCFVPGGLNSSWGDNFSEAMRAYVGEDACRLSAAHSNFIRKEVAKGVSQTRFDPMFCM
jgi:hypothetical protein